MHLGFRGIIKASYSPTPSSGWRAIDAVDVSAIRWFRAKEVSSR